MTGTRDPQQDGSIQAMLSDSGLETAAELRSALEQLRAVVPDQAPPPRADLAALLAGDLVAAPAAAPSVAPTVDVGGPSGLAGDVVPGAVETEPDTTVVSLADRRSGRKRRLAIVGGAVIGAMSLGAGAVAASSEDFRHSVSRTVGVIFQPTVHPAPATEHVQPSPAAVPDIPAPRATPSVTGSPGVPPAGNATSSAASHGASSNGKARPGTAPAAPPAAGRDGILPTPGQRPVIPGIPGAPGQGDGKGNGSGNGKDLPRTPGHVTPTLPDVAPTKVPGQP
jgi:hypothetical protein